ncbi:hypothetical protein niasHT_034190 [Heterodera trifolii]|uniref:K Homology domain-containing protein n=1 Tax=Heterodera trifolii TaxID=157864 RepID=A0ABD2J316_9BILA
MTTESLVIPKDIANKIIDELDQNSFERWKRKGCVLEIKQRNNVRLFLNGTSTENETLLTNEIFPLFKQARDALGSDSFIFTLGLLIPNPKCGYVIGKEGKTVQKIQDDFGVEIFIDNGKREPVPEGFARLFIRSSDIDSMRWARAEIRRLEARSLEFNPYAMPRDNKKRSADGKWMTQNERIKLPPFGHFTSEQQMHFREIQKSSAINWVFDELLNLTEAGDGRFVTLEGDAELVLSAKKRLAKLITEIEDSHLHSSSVRLANSPTTGRTLYRTVVKVPSPAWRLVIGGGGKTIKGLKERFGVSMRFLGDNFVSYPHFRSLSIFGHDQMNVHSAREHIEREFVAKNDEYLGQNTSQAKAKERRKFLSTTDDPNNNIDLIDTNAFGHKTAIGGWESDEESWAVDEEAHVCSDFTMNEQKTDETVSNSEEELQKWDDEDKEEDKEEEEEQRDEKKTKSNIFGGEKGQNGGGDENTVKELGKEAESVKNEDSGIVGDGEEDELFLLIEGKGKPKEGDENDEVGGRSRSAEHQQQNSAEFGTGEITKRRTTSLSDGIGNSYVSAASSADFYADETVQQLIFQPLDRNALACQLERAKATLLGDEHLSRELARTQALLRARERECEQLRLENQRLKLQLSSSTVA